MVSDIQDAFSVLDREGKGTIGERDIKKRYPVSMPRRFAGETSVNDRKFKGSGQNAVPTGGYSTTRCLTGRITTAVNP
ncbi:hypothetical protein AVEN_158590-1 [Araneus ventricosus]|uniref:EF-hand domain-containing protein n=1 Tax=Araneus ventricosus TaxID=182803 RepID=A0A4Y2VIN3_ARAVE|nr:hypothetical protein AVEN_158590-1 [Araneus ventricosus]